MIKKEGRKWVLYNNAGSKAIGTCSTKKAALALEQTILEKKAKERKERKAEKEGAGK